MGDVQFFLKYRNIDSEPPSKESAIPCSTPQKRPSANTARSRNKILPKLCCAHLKAKNVCKNHWLAQKTPTKIDRQTKANDKFLYFIILL